LNPSRLSPHSGTPFCHPASAHAFPANLPTAQLGDLFRSAFGWHQAAAEEKAIRFYDTFDYALLRSKRLLVQHGNRLTLHTVENGWIGEPIASMACRNLCPRFAWQISDPNLRSQLQPLSTIRAVTPVLECRIWSQLAELRNAEEKTVVRFLIESLTDEQGEKREARFLHLLPLRGYDPEAEQALRLLRDHGFTDLDRTPIEWSFAQLGHPVRHYTLQPPFSLEPSMPARHAANTIIHAMLGVARLNEPGVIDDLDTEFLHDYRVALRKIRSVLSLLRGVYPDAETLEMKEKFGEFARRTNRLRDLDVYLLSRESYTGMLPEVLRPGLQQMFDDFAAERTSCQKLVVRNLKSKAYHRDLDRVGELLADPDQLPASANADMPIGEMAATQIWRRYRKIRKLARHIHPGTEAEHIHEVRIQCKKLRYLLEFSRELFPADVLGELTTQLRKLQNRLGSFNDCEVQQAALLEYQREHPGLTIELAMAIGGLVSLLHQRALDERGRIQKALETFCAKPVADRFKTTFRPAKPDSSANPS